MLKITTSLGLLLVSSETSIPLTITNPMFNDRGSGSLPFSIPDCQHNQKILGYPNRVSQSKRQNISLPATIETDIKTYTGSINYVNTSDGSIELTFYTQEGYFWDWAKKTDLRKINTLPSRVIDFLAERETYFNNAWPDVEMAFFPIATKYIGREQMDDPYIIRTFSLNNRAIADYTLINSPSDLYRPDYIENGNLLKNSGYITGFLYINEIIQWIAQTLGYRIDSSFLIDNTELRQAVVLNKSENVLGFFPGIRDYFDYSKLLPNVSVFDFIESIESTFGCRFFINSFKKTITIKSYNNVLFGGKLTNIVSKINISKNTEQKGFSITAQRSNSPYIAIDERAINNTFFDSAFRNDPVLREHDKVYVTQTDPPNYEAYPNEIVFNVPTQAYFYLSWAQNGDNWEYKATCIHSNYFDYSSEEELDQHKIEVKAELIPMVPVNFRQMINNNTYEGSYIDFVLVLPHFDNWDYATTFENGFISLNDGKCPITFAFNRGRVKTLEFTEGTYPFSSFDMPIGSPDVYSDNGSLFPLNETEFVQIAISPRSNFGIWQSFYVALSKLYLNSGNELEISNFKLSEILDKDIFEVFKNQDNINFIFKEIKITLTPSGTKFDSAVGLTVKHYL